MAERKPFLLRLPPETLAALQSWADDQLRSLNGQIEFLLRRSVIDAQRGAKLAAKPSKTSPDEG